MSENNLQRLLDLIKRELGAREARVEFGGEAPYGPESVWAPLPGGWRLVAHFDNPGIDTKRVGVKLKQMAESFFDLQLKAPEPSPEGYKTWTTRRLDDELYGLAARTGAIIACIIDFQSPVVWGQSEPRHGSENVTAALEISKLVASAQGHGLSVEELCEASEEDVRTRIARSDLPESQRSSLRHEVVRLKGLAPNRRRSELLAYRAIALLRGTPSVEAPPPSGHFRQVCHETGFGFLARSFASIYILVLVFDDNYSELHAEAALLHSLPVIERLVLALPPIEPPPKGGRVVKLPVPGRDA